MKRMTKVFANLFALLITVCLCFSFTACEDLKTLEITVAVYDTDTQQMTDKTLTVKLYRHLAPKTVDAIVGYAGEGYYDNAIFYVDENHSSQIMMGEFKFDSNKKIVQNLDKDGKMKPALPGEFEAGGTTGSDLVNKEGSIGLWRSYIGSDYKLTDSSIKSGRATWFMPVDSSSCMGYDGYFCVFAQFDYDGNSDNVDCWEGIQNLLFGSDSSYYIEYSIYYTGEYSEEAELNNGLTFHSELRADYEEMIKDEDFEESVFKAEDEYLNCYNQYYIKVPVFDKENKTNRDIACYVKSVKVK